MKKKKKKRINQDKYSFTCPCGRVEVYPMYVYAHSTAQLRFKCPDCGRNFVIENFQATEDLDV